MRGGACRSRASAREMRGTPEQPSSRSTPLAASTLPPRAEALLRHALPRSSASLGRNVKVCLRGHECLGAVPSVRCAPLSLRRPKQSFGEVRAEAELRHEGTLATHVTGTFLAWSFDAHRAAGSPNENRD